MTARLRLGKLLARVSKAASFVPNSSEWMPKRVECRGNDPNLPGAGHGAQSDRAGFANVKHWTRFQLCCSGSAAIPSQPRKADSLQSAVCGDFEIGRWLDCFVPTVDAPYRPKETRVRLTLTWPTDPPHDFIGRHRAAKTLQRQIANKNGFGQRLDSADDALADENLAGFGLLA